MSSIKARRNARKKLQHEDRQRSLIHAELEFRELAKPPEDPDAWLKRRAQEILEDQRTWRKSFLKRRKGLMELPKGLWRRMWRGALWKGGPTRMIPRRRAGNSAEGPILFDDFGGLQRSPRRQLRSGKKSD